MSTPTPTSHGYDWSRITVPLSGANSEPAMLKAATEMARHMGAQLSCTFVPPDPSELTPWIAEGLMAGAQVNIYERLEEATHESEARSLKLVNSLDYEPKQFRVLNSPIWFEFAEMIRLSDVVVYNDDQANGLGILSEAFQITLMEERAGVFIARTPFDVTGHVLVAWDGKEPSSRAARRAIPLLKRASRVTLVTISVGDNCANLGHLAEYYALHGIVTESIVLEKTNDVSKLLHDTYDKLGAQYLVSGAYGHSRLREFVFGGTTRALLQKTKLNLFMAH